MFESISPNNSDNNDKSVYNLYLNEQDRFADLIFYIGILIALKSTDVTEQFIILSQNKQLSAQEQSALIYEIAKLLALANWLYFSAANIHLSTSSARLEEEKASALQNSSPLINEVIRGRELIVAGNTFKIIGFLLTASGNEIIANSAIAQNQLPKE